MENPEFQGPGNYLIRLRGDVSKQLLAQLSDITINTSTVSDDLSVTTLVGHISSQLSLTSTLKKLCSLKFYLLSVECLDEQQ